MGWGEGGDSKKENKFGKEECVKEVYFLSMGRVFRFENVGQNGHFLNL